jgi:hypothetical protein
MVVVSEIIWVLRANLALRTLLHVAKERSRRPGGGSALPAISLNTSSKRAPSLKIASLPRRGLVPGRSRCGTRSSPFGLIGRGKHPHSHPIKLRCGPYRQFIAAWKDSLVAVAKAGVPVVCYNFMPLVDWTRTNLKWRLPSTGYALRFDAVDFAAYDLFLLARPGADRDYPAERIAQAHIRSQEMSASQKSELERAILAGLPGAEPSYDRKMFLNARADWEG